jgi:hypothetical protein
MEMLIWNVVLTAFLGILGFVLREKSDEISRLNILVNRTREEHAKEYVTKADMHLDINRVLDRLDRMESKLDSYMKESRSALS